MGLFTAEVERLLQAARLHLGKGELHEAVGQVTEVIRRDSKQPAAYLVRAEAHRRLNHPDRALADLAVAIRLDPNQPDPYVIRAEILKRRNLLDQSIADATHALSLDPRNAAAFSIRAESRSAIGDVEGAGEDVQEMLLIDPTRPVPTLEARRASTSSEVELGNERFWKQAGGADPKRQLEIFADGKPVDKTYRSRRVVNDEEAPEALGVASGYKPETIAQPIPRIRAPRKQSNLSWLFIGIGLAGAVLLGFVLANRGSVGPESVKAPSPAQSTASQPTNRQSPDSIAPSQPISPTTPDDISSVRSTPHTAQVPPTGTPESTSPAGSASPRAMNEPPDGFMALFNGIDLTNWREAIPGNWHVRDGILHHDGGGGNLITTREYGDFELLVDWKIDPGGDSGIYLRGKPQVQIWDDPVGSGGLFNNKRNPSKPMLRADNPVGEWNTFRIIISGSIVTVYLNDQLVVNQVEMESYPDYRGPILKRGAIEIQHFRSHLQFRNIFIRGFSANDHSGTPSSSSAATSMTNVAPRSPNHGIVNDLEQTDAQRHSVDRKASAADPASDEKSVANWVCWMRGHLTIEMENDKSVVEVRSPDDLPPSGYQVLGIDLAKLNVSDNDINRFSHLKRVESINLWETAITDSGMSVLVQLDSLQDLTIGKTRVTDDGLRTIDRLTNLRSLNLAALSIGKSGLSQVGRLRHLETLLLGGVQANDDAIGQLSNLTNLKLLGLIDNSAVTNAAIPRLKNLKRLETIRLRGTRIDDEVVRRYLPGCGIAR